MLSANPRAPHLGRGVRVDSFGPNTQIEVRELRAKKARFSMAYQRPSEQLDRMIQLLEQWAPPTVLPVETTPIAVSLGAAIPMATIEPAAPSLLTISAEAPS